MALASPSKIRAHALDFAQRVRSHPFKRVSKKFLEAVEINARQFIEDRVRRHPSRGVTLE